MSLARSTESRAIRPAVLLYPILIWILLAVIAVANGIFRELFLIPRIGEYPGHVLSTAVLVAAIFLVASIYFTSVSIDYTETELLLVGVGWTLATVGFEFLVGYLEGTPTSVTIGQYDVLAGQVWIFVPLALLFAPLLFGSWLAR